MRLNSRLQLPKSSASMGQSTSRLPVIRRICQWASFSSLWELYWYAIVWLSLTSRKNSSDAARARDKAKGTVIFGRGCRIEWSNANRRFRDSTLNKSVPSNNTFQATTTSLATTALTLPKTWLVPSWRTLVSSSVSTFQLRPRLLFSTSDVVLWSLLSITRAVERLWM